MTLPDQLSRLAQRGPVADPRFVVRRALHDAAGDGPPPYRMSHTQPTRPRRRPRRFLAIAVTVLVITGAAGLLAARDRRAAPATGSLPTATVDPPADSVPAPNALLDTQLKADDRPLVMFDRPGWTVDTFYRATPVEPMVGSAACPGCGEARLVVAADGPLLAGGVFTAWVLTESYELIGQLDAPVTIWDGVAGGASTSPTGTPLDQSWTTLAWAIADGPGAPIAIVDARGLPYDQVVAMAQALTFGQSIELPEVPAGMRVVSRPEWTAPRAQITFVAFTDADRWKGLQVLATNRGVQALFDWQYWAFGDLIGGDWETRTIGGTTVAFDWSDENGVEWGTAWWVAGEWAYRVDGPRFGADEFAAAIAELHLVDQATFDAQVGAPDLAYELDPVRANGWATLRRFDPDES